MTPIAQAINDFERENEITDHEYELARKCCIYGHAFEYLYQDEEAKTKMTICTPWSCSWFMTTR